MSDVVKTILIVIFLTIAFVIAGAFEALSNARDIQEGEDYGNTSTN